MAFLFVVNFIKLKSKHKDKKNGLLIERCRKALPLRKQCDFHKELSKTNWTTFQSMTFRLLLFIDQKDRKRFGKRGSFSIGF